MSDALDEYRISAQRRARALVLLMLSSSTLALIVSIVACASSSAVRPAGILLQRGDAAWVLIFYALSAGSALLHAALGRGSRLPASPRTPARALSGTRSGAALLTTHRLAQWALAVAAISAMVAGLRLLG